MSMNEAPAEIVVIGGGIMGTSIAWNLARRGAGRIVLLERATIGAGASGRTGALLRRHYSNRPEAMLAQKSWEIYRNWREIVGGDCGFVPHGLIVTVDTSAGHEANIERVHQNVALQRSLGIDARVISPAELGELQPFTSTDDIAAAAYESNSGYVDAIAATRSMAQAAIRAGVEIHEHCGVTAIECQGDRISAVHTINGRIPTETVISAIGPWTPTMLAPLGITLPITALRVQVAIIQRPLDLEPDHFVYVDTAAGMFCRPWGPGRSLVGVGGGDQHNAVDPDNFEERNDPGYAAQAISAMARRLPAAARSTYLHGHAGLYDMTPDAHPIIGPAGLEGLYVACGFSGAGFKKGPAVGQCLAELALDGRSTTVDLSPFTPARFETDAWKRPWS
ncbi:MAG TPA: FAD-dependent oxidoreductase, partial [Thermomicrobiales bacterium]|nr:FAD-dependent oxidoreductase [Thermomicrobiales bacterium]